MASAMRKMAVYLGLVEDEHRYQDGYEAYEEYEEDDEEADRVEGPDALADQPGPGPSGSNGHSGPSPYLSAPSRQESVRHTTDLTRITTLHPRTYNEARTIGEHFREGIPVIMNLTEMVDSDAKRLVDFAAGLTFGLHGSIERVTNKVFLLSPHNITVTAADKQRIAEGGFYNQS